MTSGARFVCFVAQFVEDIKRQCSSFEPSTGSHAAERLNGLLTIKPLQLFKN